MEEILPIYRVKVEQVISGDDLVGMVELCHDDLFKRVRMRLHKVDTPDAYQQGHATKAGIVRDTVRQMVSNCPCTIQVVTQGRKGWIVNLFMHKDKETVNLNDYLINEGFIFREKTNAKKETAGKKAQIS